jgi:NAD(P)-dependent dehydrogenase (short-subunit alcohol dehydrogenase family)
MTKTVFITGASSGIGRAAAKLFHEKGWNVVATMRSPGKEQELTGLDRMLVARLDVENTGSIRQAVDTGLDTFGRIDALVNSAGYGLMGVFESATIEQIRKQFDVNVFGLMQVTQAVLPYMRRQQSGVVINISSFGGITANRFGSLYNSSKFAVEGFSEALSHELAFLNIAVKIIEPGSIATNFRHGMVLIQNGIDVYDAEFAAMLSRYAQRTAHLQKATAGDVANAVYQAATDNQTKLRYIVGKDAQFYIDAKLKNSESDFLNIMRD